MTSLRLLLPVAILILAGCAGGPPAAEDGTTTTRATTPDREPTTVATTSPRSTATTTTTTGTATPTTTATPALTPTRDCGSPDTTPSVPAVGANGSPGVAVEEVTARPGETVDVNVTARNVGEIHVQFQGGEALGIRGTPDFVPSEEQIYPTVEPYFEWDRVEPEVTGTVPVSVDEDAQPGTYCDASLVVWNDTDHDHRGGARARFVVHVVDGTGDR